MCNEYGIRVVLVLDLVRLRQVLYGSPSPQSDPLHTAQDRSGGLPSKKDSPPTTECRVGGSADGRRDQDHCAEITVAVR